MDGSIHDWLGTGKHHCLLNMVDDATSTSLSTLASGETTRVVFECFKKWLEKYGIPLAIYVDLKNVYVSNKRHPGFCHFEVACNKLGVRIIKAYSPQAKGRVERNHAVYQDRF
ncbi:TPA: DDE-type integrase/transposase/recombinase, partial [Legionella pneumophila]|nr:DDE-type integrase/transposase/recombinase [Legionella pneumophila]